MKPHLITLAEETSAKVLRSVQEHVMRPLTEKLKAVSVKQESTDQLVADLDRRITELERSRSAS
ncbi:MAG: hypothetical protein KIT13_03705 [Burkholderiales bacterium]|nr:hypothetical protein [Burkholderiales bacterium]